MNRLVIIAGPTACGKSAAAVELSKRLDGSVISADSVQVYKGMDIGSAKITKEEMQEIPHYLIDILDPREEWSAALFQKRAGKAIEEITKKGRLPILAGGTGFYIQSLLYGIDFSAAGPASPADTAEDAAPEHSPGTAGCARRDIPDRKALEALALREGPEKVHALLEKADPVSAAAIHPNNVKRTIRALEFLRESGSSILLHNEQEHLRPPAYDAVYFVMTMDREKLYQRIDARVDLMLENGLIEEVKRLKDAGLDRSHVSMQALGYRQILAYLDGEISLEEAVQEIKTGTRHFAKRQLTWFRREEKRNPSLLWIDADRFSDTSTMLDHMEQIIRDHYGL